VKIFFTLFALLAVVLAAYPFINQSEKTETLTGLPWQIEILADGSTQVFGLHIGTSRLADAVEKLGSDMDLAIISATDAEEVGSLEMYYGHYRAGLLSGKLVLQTDISEQTIKRWRDNAPRSEYMASGLAKKYMLSPDDLVQVLDEVIVGLTFIPAVNLDEEVILARFEKSKEVLQYVKPANFSQLVTPLQ